MMSLFKKSNRKSQKSNQRTRFDDSDEDNNHSIDADLDGFESKFKVKTKLDPIISDNGIKSDHKIDTDLIPKLEIKPKVASNPKLSFAVEEEDESDVFKVKKSSYSRRLANQRENRVKKKRDVKKEVKTNEENQTVDENKDKNRDDLNVIWIKSKEIKEEPKSPPKEEMKIFSGDQIESDSEYEDNEPEEYKSNEPFHHFRGALERGVIPDAKTIYELKKQRQMARDIDELIIPLADDDRYEESDSRVIRDDDNDRSDEDDDDDERISFAINRDNIERQKAKEAFLMAQEEEEEAKDMSRSESESSEDEIDRWEREQIRKGVRMPVIQMLNQEQASSRAISGLFIDNMN
ncbi:unnamed protein product, partial [Oppiella nova]